MSGHHNPLLSRQPCRTDPQLCRADPSSPIRFNDLVARPRFTPVLDRSNNIRNTRILGAVSQF